MFHWNTKQIADDIRQLDDIIEDVIIESPGGDVDTYNVCAKVRGADEYIIACGFDPDTWEHDDQSDTDVTHVEVTDQSGNGLQSDDFNVAQAYITVRQYFVGKGVPVVGHLKDYF